MKSVLASLQLKPNKPERKLIGLIESCHLPFTYTGDKAVVVNGMNPDFMGVREKKIIEVFGDYWHGKRARTKRETELGRKEAYDVAGYEALVVWEHELENEAGVMQKLRCFTEAKKSCQV